MPLNPVDTFTAALDVAITAARKAGVTAEEMICELQAAIDGLEADAAESE